MLMLFDFHSRQICLQACLSFFITTKLQASRNSRRGLAYGFQFFQMKKGIKFYTTNNLLDLH
jgi:hypothetical protein